MLEWKVPLHGLDEDLALLVGLFNTPALQVTEEADGYYLRSTEFEPIPDGGVVLHRARCLVEMMNGVATLIEMGYHQVSAVSRVAREGNDGDGEHHFVYAEDTLYVRESVQAIIRRPDGTAERPEPPAAEARAWFELAERDSAVAEVLRHLLAGEPYRLYKVLEIIRRDVGGENSIVQADWASKRELRRFRWSVNEGLGDQARHASGKVKPPSNPMSHNDAYWFIRRILRQWMESKSNGASRGQ